jgi:isocitrate/isopropylmalate dehydrogenase
MLLTVKLMFDWLGEAELADRLEGAIARVISDGNVATYDVKGRGKGDSTTAVADEIARKL